MRAVKIRIPLIINEEEKLVTGELIEKSQAPLLEYLRRDVKPVVHLKKEQASPAISVLREREVECEASHNPLEIKVLGCVTLYPGSGVAELFDHIKGHRADFNKARERLLVKEWIRADPAPRGRKKCFIPTDHGLKTLRDSGMKIPGKGSAEHTSMQIEVFNTASAAGWNAQIESHQKGHQFDVFLVSKKGIEIAVEVVVSGKQEVKNAKLALSRVRQVIFVTNTKDRLGKVKKVIFQELDPRYHSRISFQLISEFKLPKED